MTWDQWNRRARVKIIQQIISDSINLDLLMFSRCGGEIATWQAFARCVRGKQEKLLNRLPEFPDSILVTGCQRSGGTMLARVLTESAGMVKYWFGKDDELDAALILSGTHQHKPQGRYCFQTTYLNERYSEYREHINNRIIWSLRNPHSVIYSMLYNWKRFALNELFIQCGYSEMSFEDRIRFQRFGIWGVSPLHRAAYAFNGKVRQLFDILDFYPVSRIAVIEYDEFVIQKNRMLPLLYDFIELPYHSNYADPISTGSIKKKDALNSDEHDYVEAICMPVYLAALEKVSLR